MTSHLRDGDADGLFNKREAFATSLRKSKTKVHQQEKREANLKNIATEAQDLKIIEEILLKDESQRTLYERLLLKQVEKMSTQPNTKANKQEMNVHSPLDKVSPRDARSIKVITSDAVSHLPTSHGN